MIFNKVLRRTDHTLIIAAPYLTARVRDARTCRPCHAPPICKCVCAPFGKWDHLPRAPGLAIWVIPLPPNSSLRTGGRWSPQSPPGTLNSRGGGGGKGRGIAFAPHPILLSHPTRCVIRGHRLLPVDLARMHHYQRLASSGFERSHPFFGMVLVACSWGS